jgi:hypothetical protein
MILNATLHAILQIERYIETYHIPDFGIKMAPPKGKKGALEEQVKDVLVMTHFLAKGNSPAYAEQIRRSWDRHAEGNVIAELPKEVGPREKSLSLTGTIQVCERLSSPERGILQRHSSPFGKKRTVVTYTLSETAEGFRRVARAMLGVSPRLFLKSSYARHCLTNVWIPEVRRRLRIEAGCLTAFDWALRRSPIALMITLDRDFGIRPGSTWHHADKWYGELGAWAGACIIADALSPSGSPRITLGPHFINFNVRAHVEGEAGVDLGGEGRIRARLTLHPEAHE